MNHKRHNGRLPSQIEKERLTGHVLCLVPVTEPHVVHVAVDQITARRGDGTDAADGRGGTGQRGHGGDQMRPRGFKRLVKRQDQRSATVHPRRQGLAQVVDGGGAGGGDGHLDGGGQGVFGQREFQGEVFANVAVGRGLGEGWDDGMGVERDGGGFVGGFVVAQVILVLECKNVYRTVDQVEGGVDGD